MNDQRSVLDQVRDLHALAVERGMYDGAEWIEQRMRSAGNERMRAALLRLEEWDMLALTADGHGAATADAPWARALIRDALTEGVVTDGSFAPFLRALGALRGDTRITVATERDQTEENERL